MRFSEEGLYRALEKVLREADEFMDCHQLYEHKDVQEHAASANRVSDYLGNMWRKGLLSRLPTTAPGSRSRWMYLWKDKTPPQLVTVQPTSKLLVDRPTVVITEEGKTIQIEMPELTILIRQK